jgi:hypothetical protein
MSAGCRWCAQSLSDFHHFGIAMLLRAESLRRCAVLTHCDASRQDQLELVHEDFSQPQREVVKRNVFLGEPL